MIPENAKNERLEHLDLADTKPGDEFAQVDFKSKKCVHSFGTVTMPEIDKFGGGPIKAILSQNRCSCGNDSGFHYDKTTRTDLDELDKLCNVLPGHMKQPTDHSRDTLKELTEQRNLKLAFTVRRWKKTKP